jgi:predicted dehydrogenase
MTHLTTRRAFLQQSGRAASVTAALSILGGVHSATAAQQSKLELGIIGCGGIMSHHVRGLASRREAIKFAWLCDIDPQQIDKTERLLSGFQSAKPKQTSRFEDVINDKNVDAVVIATPHHWHAPIALRAMESGKDTYIEKPISHVFDEGPMIIEAARKYKRVVQQGSQMRNSPVTKKAERLLADGIIGEVKVARAWTAEMRQVVKPVPDTTPPGGVDYDRWLGPAPKRAFNALRFHQTWRMFKDYGNGEIGDDGIHDLDMAAWGLGVTTLPKTITARGGRMMLHGHASEYPDNMHTMYEYPDGKLLVYENYPFTSYGLHGFDNGNVFYGTKGYMIFSRRGAFSVFLGPKEEPGPTEGRDIRGERGYAEHMAEFLDAVRTRRLETAASPHKAHLSCALVHLGEAAYRTQGRLEFDATTGKFVDCPEADELLTKSYRKPYGLGVTV